MNPSESPTALLLFLYFFFLLGDYYIVRPVRDAMGTVYEALLHDSIFSRSVVAGVSLRRRSAIGHSELHHRAQN